jgi:hypothetical protein
VSAAEVTVARARRWVSSFMVGFWCERWFVAVRSCRCDQ